MEKNKIIFLLLLIVTLAGTTKVNSQNLESTQRSTIGGIDFDKENVDVIEKADLEIYYQFKYPIVFKDRRETKTDTLMLAIGATKSICLDPLFKQKMESQRLDRIRRSKKASMIDPSHDEDDITTLKEMISEKSEYQEYDPGDPLQIYKDRSEGKIISVYNSYIDNLKCEQSKEVQFLGQWKLSTEIDTIFNYKCHKAEIVYANRHYEAWYTFDIPMNDGPWKFWGLPGLILKVKDSDGLFEWTAIGLKKVDVDIVMDKNKYEITGPSQFQDFLNKATHSVMVDFFNNSVLYYATRNRDYEKVQIELLDKK